MKNKLLLFFIFMLSMNGSFVDKMKKAQEKYLSINAAKGFYKLPLNDKMQAIKRNPGKSLLYGWGVFTLLHDSCASIDAAFAQHKKDCLMNYYNENTNSFFKCMKKNKITKIPFVFFGEFLRFLIFCPINIVFYSGSYTLVNSSECSWTGHCYYKCPTLAYSYKLYRYFFPKKKLEE